MEAAKENLSQEVKNSSSTRVRKNSSQAHEERQIMIEKNRRNLSKDSKKDPVRKAKEKVEKPKPRKLKPRDRIDYKQVDVLLSFLTEQSKIKPRRSTHLTLKQQRQLSRAVKRARVLTLLPFVKTTEK